MDVSVNFNPGSVCNFGFFFANIAYRSCEISINPYVFFAIVLFSNTLFEFP
jgi:hypothetical protein